MAEAKVDERRRFASLRKVRKFYRRLYLRVPLLRRNC